MNGGCATLYAAQLCVPTHQSSSIMSLSARTAAERASMPRRNRGTREMRMVAVRVALFACKLQRRGGGVSLQADVLPASDESARIELGGVWMSEEGLFTRGLVRRYPGSAGLT